jgi:hypothetical protein
MNKARTLSSANSGSLLHDLEEDHRRVERLRTEATAQLAEARARLQVIEAAASRRLTQNDTELMLNRLVESQNQIPLAIEILRLEQEALRDAGLELAQSSKPPVSE